jgi:competence CoiA-like predicted nuclease
MMRTRNAAQKLYQMLEEYRYKEIIMLYGIHNGEKVRASKLLDATCPCCQSKLVAKMGNHVIHHWSHAARNDCPHIGKESAWHLKWKNAFRPKYVEVFKSDDIGIRISDVCIHGVNLEFQNSPISHNEAWSRCLESTREGHALWWIFNGKVPPYSSLEIKEKHWQWKRMPQPILCILDWIEDRDSKIKLFIDTGSGVIELHSHKQKYGRSTATYIGFMRRFPYKSLQRFLKMNLQHAR